MQAKGRLQCWNADGQELGGSCREGCAGKGQAATLEQQRQSRFHTSGGPRRRPCLGEGQGRRITNSQMATQSKACNAVGGDGRLYRWPTLHLK